MKIKSIFITIPISLAFVILSAFAIRNEGTTINEPLEGIVIYTKSVKYSPFCSSSIIYQGAPLGFLSHLHVGCSSQKSVDYYFNPINFILDWIIIYVISLLIIKLIFVRHSPKTLTQKEK
jgi:hypothetical protein